MARAGFHSFLHESVFRRSVQRFAAENASNTRSLEHDPIPSGRIVLWVAAMGFIRRRHALSCGLPRARAASMRAISKSG
jgi:hypothetical protein